MDHITVEVSFLKKMVKMLEKRNEKEVTFEFLVGSCFPNIMDNIKEEMRRQYTMGFVAGQGKEVTTNEKKN